MCVTHLDKIYFAQFDINHLQLDYNILITFIILISKLILITFICDNIDFNNCDLTLILITNIFKASELKQDGHAEEGGMIKVR